MATSNQELNLIDFMGIATDIDKCVQYMMDKNIIKTNRTCAHCDKDMHIMKKESSSDGRVWQCHSCKSTNSIRKDSFVQVCNIHINHVNGKTKNRQFGGGASDPQPPSLDTGLLLVKSLSVLTHILWYPIV